MANATSTDILDYEVLVRRRDEAGYAAYCPQLMMMVTGTAHEEVENLMREKIQEHIDKLKAEA